MKPTPSRRCRSRHRACPIFRCGILSLFLIGLLGAILTPIATAGTASEAETAPPVLDLLEAPSQPSPKAAASLILDVAPLDGRLAAVGERGHILISDDAGKTWQQVLTPVQVTLTAVDFATPREGWAVGHDGVVLHTSDGGRHWKKQIDGRKINALMIDNLETLIKNVEDRLASAPPEEKPDIEIRLENLSFFLDDQKLAVEEGPTRPLMDVWFKDAEEGLVVGAFGMILKTDDGGKNWRPLLDRIDNPDGFHYYAICRSGDALYLAGEAGMLFRSDDWGESWLRLHSPYEGSFFGIAGNADGSVIAAFGLRASLFISFNRGVSWMRKSVPTGASIAGGRFFNDGSLYLVCVDGTILRSLDGGRSFTALSERFPGSTSVNQAIDGSLVVTGVRGVNRVKRRE